MDDARYLESAAKLIGLLYSMADSQHVGRPIAEGVDKRSVRSLIRSLAIAGHPELAQSLSELASCAFWYWMSDPQEALMAKTNAINALDRARTIVKQDEVGGVEPESPQRVDFTAALIDAAILADDVAILGTDYQICVENLMFDDCSDAEGEDGDGEDLADGPEAAAPTTVGVSADGASTYELQLAALDVGPAVHRLHSHGAAAAATALEELHAAVSRIISVIDIRKPLRGYEADCVAKVFDSDVSTLHRSVLVEINNDRVTPESLNERDVAVEVDPPLNGFPGPAFALARDDDGYLLVGPSFPTTAEADDFIEKLAGELRDWGEDDLNEISPRTFRPSHEVGEDYPGRLEFMALYSVSSVTLYVGTINDVIAAWKTKHLFSQQEDGQMSSYVYRLAGFGGMF